MTRHLHIEPVDLVDLLAAEWAQEEVGRHSPLSPLRGRAANLRRRLAGSRFNPGRIIAGDCFFLITGAMVALDLCLIVWLVQR